MELERPEDIMVKYLQTQNQVETLNSNILNLKEFLVKLIFRNGKLRKVIHENIKK